MKEVKRSIKIKRERRQKVVGGLLQICVDTILYPFYWIINKFKKEGNK